MPTFEGEKNYRRKNQDFSYLENEAVNRLIDTIRAHEEEVQGPILDTAISTIRDYAQEQEISLALDSQGFSIFMAQVDALKDEDAETLLTEAVAAIAQVASDRSLTVEGLASD